MLTDQERTRIKKAMIINWFIWFAMLFSLGMYLFVAYLAGPDIRVDPLPETTYTTLMYILVGLGVVLLMVSFPLRRFMIRSVQKGNDPDPQTGPSRPDIQTVIGKYATALIISLALSESVGIFGLVLFFLGKDFQTLNAFLACSAVAMIFHCPRVSEIENLFDN